MYQLASNKILVLFLSLLATSLVGGFAYFWLKGVDINAIGNTRAINYDGTTEKVRLPGIRGSIMDRHGQYLAISTKTKAIWIKPKLAIQHLDELPALAQAINRDHEWLLRRLSQSTHRESITLRRHMKSPDAKKILDLGIPGLVVRDEYRRYYPAFENTSHVLGFTDIDDRGKKVLSLLLMVGFEAIVDPTWPSA